MTLRVHLELGYAFAVKAKAREVFDVLSDVPTSAGFFPNVEHLVDLGQGVYRWEMAKIGIASLSLQTVYASRYAANRARGTVVWEPVQGEGNAEVSGDWRISPRKSGTQLELRLQGDLTLPLPALMKLVVAPLVQKEFTQMVEQYIANLTQRFGGSA